MSTFEVKTQAEIDALSLNASAKGRAYFNDTDGSIVAWDGTAWRGYLSDGVSGNALSLEFDGGDRLDTTYSGLGNALSISFWMKSSDLTEYSIFFDSNNESFNLWRPPGQDTAGNVFWMPTYRTGSGINQNDPNRTQGGTVLYTRFSSHDAAYTAGSSNSFCDGTWHHVVVTLANEDVDGTTTSRYIMYKDGEEFVNQLCTTDNGWTNNNPYSGGSGLSPYTIGGSTNSSTLYYNGYLDQIAFFQTALTPTDVTNIYNNGNGGNLPNLGFEPEAYYKVGHFSDTIADGTPASAGNDIGTVADYSENVRHASQTTVILKPNYIEDTPWH